MSIRKSQGTCMEENTCISLSEKEREYDDCIPTVAPSRHFLTYSGPSLLGRLKNLFTNSSVKCVPSIDCKEEENNGSNMSLLCSKNPNANEYVSSCQENHLNPSRSCCESPKAENPCRQPTSTDNGITIQPIENSVKTPPKLANCKPSFAAPYLFSKGKSCLRYNKCPDFESLFHNLVVYFMIYFMDQKYADKGREGPTREIISNTCEQFENLLGPEFRCVIAPIVENILKISEARLVEPSGHDSESDWSIHTRQMQLDCAMNSLRSLNSTLGFYFSSMGKENPQLLQSTLADGSQNTIESCIKDGWGVFVNCVLELVYALETDNENKAQFNISVKYALHTAQVFGEFMDSLHLHPKQPGPIGITQFDISRRHLSLDTLVLNDNNSNSSQHIEQNNSMLSNRNTSSPSTPKESTDYSNNEKSSNAFSSPLHDHGLPHPLNKHSMIDFESYSDTSRLQTSIDKVIPSNNNNESGSRDSSISLPSKTKDGSFFIGCNTSETGSHFFPGLHENIQNRENMVKDTIHDYSVVQYLHSPCSSIDYFFALERPDFIESTSTPKSLRCLDDFWKKSGKTGFGITSCTIEYVSPSIVSSSHRRVNQKECMYDSQVNKCRDVPLSIDQQRRHKQCTDFTNSSPHHNGSPIRYNNSTLSYFPLQADKNHEKMNISHSSTKPHVVSCSDRTTPIQSQKMSFYNVSHEGNNSQKSYGHRRPNSNSISSTGDSLSLPYSSRFFTIDAAAKYIMHESRLSYGFSSRDISSMHHNRQDRCSDNVIEFPGRCIFVDFTSCLSNDEHTQRAKSVISTHCTSNDAPRHKKCFSEYAIIEKRNVKPLNKSNRAKTSTTTTCDTIPTDSSDSDFSRSLEIQCSFIIDSLLPDDSPDKKNCVNDSPPPEMKVKCMISDLREGKGVYLPTSLYVSPSNEIFLILFEISCYSLTNSSSTTSFHDTTISQRYQVKVDRVALFSPSHMSSIFFMECFRKIRDLELYENIVRKAEEYNSIHCLYQILRNSSTTSYLEDFMNGIVTKMDTRNHGLSLVKYMNPSTYREARKQLMKECPGSSFVRFPSFVCFSLKNPLYGHHSQWSSKRKESNKCLPSNTGCFVADMHSNVHDSTPNTSDCIPEWLLEYLFTYYKRECGLTTRLIEQNRGCFNESYQNSIFSLLTYHEYVNDLFTISWKQAPISSFRNIGGDGCGNYNRVMGKKTSDFIISCVNLKKGLMLEYYGSPSRASSALSYIGDILKLHSTHDMSFGTNHDKSPYTNSRCYQQTPSFPPNVNSSLLHTNSPLLCVVNDDLPMYCGSYKGVSRGPTNHLEGDVFCVDFDQSHSSGNNTKGSSLCWNSSSRQHVVYTRGDKKERDTEILRCTPISSDTSMIRFRFTLSLGLTQAGDAFSNPLVNSYRSQTIPTPSLSEFQQIEVDFDVVLSCEPFDFTSDLKGESGGRRWCFQGTAFVSNRDQVRNGFTVSCKNPSIIPYSSFCIRLYFSSLRSQHSSCSPLFTHNKRGIANEGFNSSSIIESCFKTGTHNNIESMYQHSHCIVPSQLKIYGVRSK